MKAFLIDPNAETITEVEQSSLKDLYRLIECDTICAAHIEGRDVIYVDDNGLYAEPPMPCFTYRGYPHILTGKGVVVGTTDEGDDVEPAHTLQQLTARITWLGVQDIEPTINVYSWP